MIVNRIPRVLIASPTSKRHKHLIVDWLNHLDKLTYSAIDICLVDTTPESDSFFNFIRNKKVKKREIICWRRPWEPKKEYALQMLANVREDIRQYFIQHKEYDYLFWLDDDIFLPKNGVQRLLSAQKDLVGFYVHVYYKPHRRPCIFKSGEIVVGKGLEYFSFAEINAYKEFARKFKKNKLSHSEKLMVPFVIKDIWRPHLFQPYAVNLGCCMCSRKVSEIVPFRTHPTFLMGEDLWWFNECNDKNFKFWCDTSCRPEHKNTTWNDVNKMDLRYRRSNGIYIAMGPEKADGFAFVDRGQENIKKLKEKLKNDNKK